MLFSNEKVWEAPFWKVPRLFGHCPNSFWPSGGHIGQLVIFSFSRWQLQTFVQGKIQRGGDWTSPARNTCVQKKVETFFIKKYLFSVPQMVHPPPVLLSGPTARHSLEHMGPHRSHCNISLWLVRFYNRLESTMHQKISSFFLSKSYRLACDIYEAGIWGTWWELINCTKIFPHTSRQDIAFTHISTWKSLFIWDKILQTCRSHCLVALLA